MTILNVSEINHAAIEVAGFTIPVQPVAEAQLTLPVTARGAGQRRLRREMACAPMLKAANEHPADDLQKVYEKYNNRPRDRIYSWNDRPETYFASIGDIDALKVLIKYGVNISNQATAALMYTAIYDGMYSKWMDVPAMYRTIRFLADSGAVMTTDWWMSEVSRTEHIDPHREYKGNWRYIDMSEEKLMTLEYLLDHGTKVNPEYGRPLTQVIQLQARDGAEQAYKDRLIKMLVDRGAKL